MKCKRKVKLVFPDAKVVPEILAGAQGFQVVMGYGRIPLSPVRGRKKDAWRAALDNTSYSPSGRL